MAKSNQQRQRYNNSRNETIEISFKQITVDKSVNLCHRDEEVLKPEKLEDLSTSLIQEGLATPMTVYDSGQTMENEDGMPIPVYTLISGHRRFRALQQAITNRLDLNLIHDNMRLSVVVMVPGDAQPQDAFNQDVLVRSVTENEQRTKHTALERLEIVKQLEDTKVPVPRAAAALSISQTQYSRDQLVVQWDWLHQAVKDDKIGASDAATLAETADEFNREKQFHQDFEVWVREKQRRLDDERRDYEKLDKKFAGSVARIKKYMNSKIVKYWQKCMEKKQSFGDDPLAVTFGVVVNDSDRKLTISGLNSSFDKLSSEDVTTLIKEMQMGVRHLVPLKRELEQAERSRNVSQADVDAELQQIRQQAEQEAAERAAEEAGREPTESTEPGEAESHGIGDEIERELNRNAANDENDTEDDDAEGDD